MAKRSLSFTPLADAELRSIAKESQRMFGEIQALAYSAKLQERLGQLCHFPEPGINRDQLSSGLRSTVVESHVVFYRFDQTFVSVRRILNHRQDASRQDWDADE